MENLTLQYKDWYSIENVCSVLNANIYDLQDLIEQEILKPYGKLRDSELLAFKDLNDKGLNDKAFYGGCAKVNYS